MALFWFLVFKLSLRVGRIAMCLGHVLVGIATQCQLLVERANREINALGAEHALHRLRRERLPRPRKAPLEGQSGDHAAHALARTELPGPAKGLLLGFVRNEQLDGTPLPVPTKAILTGDGAKPKGSLPHELVTGSLDGEGSLDAKPDQPALKLGDL